MPSQGNFLWLRSDPGDVGPLGAGDIRQFDNGNASFVGSHINERSVSVTIRADGGRTQWGVRLSAPDGGRMVPGATYEFVPNGVMDVGGEGRFCPDSFGRFTVWEVLYGGGSRLERLHANFEHHCSGGSPALRGDICFVLPNAGPGCPHAEMPPLAGSTARSLLSFDSPAGEPVGGGSARMFTLSSATFWPVVEFFHNQVRLEVRAFDGSIWSLRLSAPNGQPLQIGTYENANNQVGNLSQPKITFERNGVSCSQVATGRFVVRDVAYVQGYGSKEFLRRLHATFEQTCRTGAPRLTGEVIVAADPWR